MKICEFCGAEITGKGKRYCGHACSNRARRIKERAARTTHIVWSCGGGVQSTAIAALIYTGKIAKPDYSVMVDTGYEKTAVMDYVRGVLVPKLAEVGATLNIIQTSDYTDQHIIDADGYCIIPAFKRKGGEIQKLRTCCNDKWKVHVIRDWLRAQGVEQYVSLIGISTDEAHRQRKAHKKYYTNTYPLIGLGLDRDACVDYITKMAGWPEPPRSSCIICGQQDDGAWWRMRVTQPEDFERAAQLERQLQAQVPGIYLHRSCKPLREAFKL